MTRRKKATGKDAKLPNPLADGRKPPADEGIKKRLLEDLKAKAKTLDLEMIEIIATAEKAVLEGKDALSQIFRVQDLAANMRGDEQINVGIAVNDALYNLLRNEKSRDEVVDAMLERLVGKNPLILDRAGGTLAYVFVVGDDEEAKTFVIQKITAFMHSEDMIREMGRNSPAYTRAARAIANFFDGITGKFNMPPEEAERNAKRVMQKIRILEAEAKEAKK